MCVPPMTIMGAQMLMNIAATKQQTAAQTAMYDAQAKMADYNARLSERKAEQIADNYAKEQRQLNSRMRLVAGKNRAEAGASKLMMSGTPLSMLAAGYDAYNEDNAQLLQNQRNDVDTQNIQTANYQNQAAGARASIANAKRAGKMQMLGSILSGAASMSGYLNDYKQTATAKPYEGVGDYMKSTNYNPYGFSNMNTGFKNYNRTGEAFSSYNSYAGKKW